MITIIIVLFLSGPKEWAYRGHNYFFSGHIPHLKNTRVDWLDARNICREYCMDLVSMETQEENNMIFRLIQQSKKHKFPKLNNFFFLILQTMCHIFGQAAVSATSKAVKAVAISSPRASSAGSGQQPAGRWHLPTKPPTDSATTLGARLDTRKSGSQITLNLTSTELTNPA